MTIELTQHDIDVLYAMLLTTNTYLYSKMTREGLATLTRNRRAEVSHPLVCEIENATGILFNQT